MKRLMNRKGLTPFSSTAILLAISLLIGILVMTWGRSYVEQATATVPAQSIVSAPDTTVLQDLNVRLANGEISKEQYDKIKEVLLTQQATK